MQAVQASTTTEIQTPTTDVSTIVPLVERLRRAFDRGQTRSLEWRLSQLEGIERMLEQHEKEIQSALFKDLGKPDLESLSAEIIFTKNECQMLRKKLPSWSKPEKVGTGVLNQPGSSAIYRDPLGVALIIAPWNYPFQLALGPLLGAIAGGNCAVVKPSEVTPNVSALLKRLLENYVDNDCVAVVEGGVEETTKLLEQRWDHIFYTGNGTVGRIVMRAAAEHLTPVVLELGGKSPCIVDRNVDLEVACRRIAWGKYYNAGQTCVAPDYALVHEDIHDKFLDQMKATVAEFYGSDPKQSEDFGRIVNERHHRRLMKLMDSGEQFVGGDANESDCYIAPTILKDVSPDSAVMTDEIFGPILPVLKVKSVNDAIRFVNERDKPLALYVFSTDTELAERVLERTSSGGATVNHTFMHLLNPNLPFGGVGESGMGAYHGKGSYEVFCHHKSVLKRSTRMDPPIAYPPYTDSKKKWLKRLM